MLPTFFLRVVEFRASQVFKIFQKAIRGMFCFSISLLVECVVEYRNNSVHIRDYRRLKIVTA